MLHLVSSLARTYHSLFKHAVEHYFIVSGRTSNTEKEEATFNSTEAVTILTSKHRPKYLITNALIQLQAKDALNENQTTLERESKITKMYEFIQRNIVISFHWIKKYTSHYHF